VAERETESCEILESFTKGESRQTIFLPPDGGKNGKTKLAARRANHTPEACAPLFLLHCIGLVAGGLWIRTGETPVPLQSTLSQRLVQIGNQVFDIFQAQRETDEVVGDAEGLAKFGCVIEERHDGHLGHEAFRTAEAGSDVE
jgi:hypothetical protein